MLSIANTVMSAMLLGGPGGQPMNWKFNRINVNPFPLISFQQDYFVPGVVTLGWLESCWANQFSSTAQPKPKMPVEVTRDTIVMTNQPGYPAKICWLPNKLLMTGTWGATEISTITGQNNPGPGVVYTNPLTATTGPSNPITQITDPNGNLWVVTTYGTCGNTQPSWPSTPSFPTYQNPNTAATTVTDGTVVWTAVNPNGQGFRINSIPPQQGMVFTINPIAQSRLVQFTTLGQTLEPIPDDYYQYFLDGCLAQCYRRHPDAKVRARFKDEWAIWLRSLDMAVRQENRENTDYGFVPGQSIMSGGFGYWQQNPAYPFGGWPGVW